MTQKDCPLAAPACDDLKIMNNVMTEVRLQLREVVTEMRGINDLVKRVEALDRLSAETAEAVKSTQKRLDSMDATVKWLIGTTISLGALSIAAIGLILKAVGAG
ncbi:hemolysin XhlA family protein [Gorillibacterium massiliense]|uniref:hemolysin XhlA family protein n=1 Tax=Gorillibacterium massiliense TaxID=1280390 RepID=UPI0005951E47|nr:hemolysin XhlA family protein [Gorillibacterium massiliense]